MRGYRSTVYRGPVDTPRKGSGQRAQYSAEVHMPCAQLRRGSSCPVATLLLHNSSPETEPRGNTCRLPPRGTAPLRVPRYSYFNCISWAQPAALTPTMQIPSPLLQW